MRTEYWISKKKNVFQPNRRLEYYIILLKDKNKTYVKRNNFIWLENFVLPKVVSLLSEVIFFLFILCSVFLPKGCARKFSILVEFQVGTFFVNTHIIRNEINKKIKTRHHELGGISMTGDLSISNTLTRYVRNVNTNFTWNNLRNGISHTKKD